MEVDALEQLISEDVKVQGQISCVMVSELASWSLAEPSVGQGGPWAPLLCANLSLSTISIHYCALAEPSVGQGGPWPPLALCQSFTIYY
jgi:hypothetical protein